MIAYEISLSRQAYSAMSLPSMLHAVTRITIPTVPTQRTQPTARRSPSFDTPNRLPHGTTNLATHDWHPRG
jgi:hypothetical protein